MNCKTIQDLLLTDSLDNELDSRQQKLAEDHLATCSACREFALTVKNTVQVPFDNARRPEPPAYLWKNIQSMIEEERSRPAIFVILENLLERMRFPKPVFAFSTIGAIVIMVFFLIKIPFYVQQRSYQQSAKQTIEEQIEYFANNNGIEEISFGTNTEEYFL
jgi:predicted anti-sigma-YlaC factor YlaD